MRIREQVIPRRKARGGKWVSLFCVTVTQQCEARGFVVPGLRDLDMYRLLHPCHKYVTDCA